VADRSDVLDRAFHALSDPSRRQMLDRLAGGPASVSDLAQPLSMTLAAVLQHVQVLEASGLIESHKAGRVRVCSIDHEALRRAEQWFTDRRAVWERRLDRLAAVLDEDAMPDAPAPTRKRGRRP
jgi:DNA-binding transcriptional ArsR family regulator